MVNWQVMLAGASPADREYVETFFADALAAMLSCERVDVEGAVSARPHLKGAIEGAMAMALSASGAREREGPVNFGGYKIVKEIGRGGMGVVYLAEQESLGRRVALKVLQAEQLISPSARERFEREAKAIASIRDPAIVTVFDLVTDGKRYGFTMDWVEGESLGTVLSRMALVTTAGTMWKMDELSRALRCGPLDSARLAAMDAQRWVAMVGVTLAGAMAAVHARGFFHRDIKPSNVLLRTDGSAMLSDFGLVMTSDDNETGRWLDPVSGQWQSVRRVASGEAETRVSSRFAGTVAYAAPETLRGQAPGKRSDIYGLGVTLYHALALRPAFAGEDARVTLEQITRGEAPPLRSLTPSVSEELAAIVEKAMSARVEARYRTAEAMAEDLRRFIAGEPVAAARARRGIVRRVAGAVTGAATVARRDWVVAVVLAAVVLVVAVVVFGVGWWMGAGG